MPANHRERPHEQQMPGDTYVQERSGWVYQIRDGGTARWIDNYIEQWRPRLYKIRPEENQTSWLRLGAVFYEQDPEGSRRWIWYIGARRGRNPRKALIFFPADDWNGKFGPQCRAQYLGQN